MTRSFTDPHAWARHKKAQLRKIPRSVRAEDERQAELAKKDALMLVSGTVPREVINRTRPFSRRRPSGMRRLPINAHSNRLRNSLRKMSRTVGGRRVKDIFFTAPYAPFILARGGTRTMVARGYMAEMNRRIRRRRLAALAQAQRRALVAA